MSQRPPVAIVGYTYRAPGVGRKGLWEFLEAGKSAWSPVPSDRFNHNAYHHPNAEKPGFIASQGAHFLPDDIYAFDPSFFRISAEEARAMDPQHRLLLECAFEAAENAGLTLPDLLGSNTGVFAAGLDSDYNISMAHDLPTSSKYMSLGNAATMFANRLSYFFGLSGPSVTVDTACASSSYALHLACQSILAGECSTAFVGGAKLLNGPVQWSGLDTMGTLSPEGKCFSYDTKASGFGKGEGAACIIIKRLSDALACGDTVQAVIRNTVCNHSGRTQGISMPSRAAQEDLLRRLHSEIGVESNETSFMEGHGTGTPVGDPIDASAIASVVASCRSPSSPLHLGSVKSNLGHLEGASGLISIIKCIMMIERGIMLPNVDFKEMNPKIEGRERLRVLTKSAPWPSGELKRACVSNFGFGGSNAAVLLEEAPKTRAPEQWETINGNGIHHNVDGDGSPIVVADKEDRALQKPSTGDSKIEHLFVFSAQSINSLQDYLSSFVGYLEKMPETFDFARELAFTLGQRRSHFTHRAAVAASSTTSLRDQLQAMLKISKSGNPEDPIVAFTFTGQGAQYFQMSAGLRRYSEFAKTIVAAERALSDLGATWSLTEELDKHEHESRINDAELSQPACTAVQLALVVLLRSWGVVPAVVLGHSSGEIAAAFSAGLISLDAAMAIAYFRGIAARDVLKNTGVKGAMLAIGANAGESQKLLDAARGYAVVAAVNSPDSVTVSGDVATIEQIQEQAETKGFFVRRLKVGVAYHSRHMERVAESYLTSIQPFCSPGESSAGMDLARSSRLASLDVKSTEPWFMSTVTGQRESADTVHALYWVKNLLQPVQYLKAVEGLFSDRDTIEGESRVPNVIVELGPHSALQSPTKQILELVTSKSGPKSQAQVSYLPSLVRGKSAVTAMLNLAGNLFAMGSAPDLAAINQTKDSPVQALKDLPSYAWNKTVRYIHQSRLAASKLYSGAPYNRLLGWKSPYSEGNEQSFRNIFTLDDLPWIRDHVIAGDTLFPFTGFLSLAIEGFRSLSSTISPGVLVQEFHVTTSLRMEEDQRVDITTKFRPAATGTETVSSSAWTFEVLSWSDPYGWTRHAYGLIEADQSHEYLSSSPDVQLASKILDIKNTRQQQRDACDEYTLLQANHGLSYGPTFRNMVDLGQAPGAAVATVVLRQLDSDAYALSQASPVTVDPPTLDTIFHCLAAIQGASGPAPIIVPSFCLRWRISNHIVADAGRKWSIVSRLLDRDEKSGRTHLKFIIFDTTVDSSPPKPVAEIGPVRMECIAGPDVDNMRFPDNFAVKHVPYVDLLDSYVLSDMVRGTLVADAAELQQRRDLDHAAIYFLSRMLEEIANDDLSRLPFHYAKFLHWAKRAVMAQPPVTAESAALVDKVASSDDTGRMLCAVGAELPQILRGQQQPLKIMLADGLLQRTYEQHQGSNRVNLMVARYIALLAECNPELNVLEVGGGTASATLPIFEAIQSTTEGVVSNFHFTFTDLSAGFFDNARSKLSQWTGHMTYTKLDISQDPVSQGFKSESYDVVLASNVLHATPDIVATLKHAWALLKPHGKLVLMEAVKAPPHFLPFVLLDGWWLSKDAYRSNSEGPLLNKALWNDLLEANGFCGVEGHVDDHPGQPEHLFSAMWSTKRDIEGATRKKNVESSVTIFHACPEEHNEFTKTVSDDLAHQLGGTSTVKGILQHEDDVDTPMCIVIDNQHRSMLSDPSSEMFSRMKGLLLQAPSLLWVFPDESHPDAAIIQGLFRCLRIEASSSRLVILRTPFNAHGAGAIVRIVQHMMSDSNPAIFDEQEYSVIDNITHVPRLQLVEAPKETFITEAGLSVKEEQDIWKGDDAFEMTLDNVGSPDSVHFRHSDILKTELGEEEILVRVAAVGMNFRDLLLVLGSLPWHAPGLEGAGVVARVGSRVKDLQVGDRVFYIVHKAGMANFVRIPSLRAHRLPEDLDMVDAASMPVAYSTAITTILEIGRLRRGESILIHSASGAVGQACIMVAQQVGARIFATAGSAEKREFVAQTFGIPTTQIFSSRTTDFKNGILQATDNRGVDVIVNSLSGHLLQQTWDMIAENGRFIEIGKKDLLENTYLPMRHFDKNVTFSAVDLRKAATARPEAVNEWLSSIVRMLGCQKIMPIRPVTRIPISQVKTGLRKLQSGQNIGKIVVTVGPDEIVTVERLSPLQARSGNLLDPDATYLITGGTGGLGRALAPWMIKKGARNLVLLGRSSTRSAKVMELLKRYEGTDVRIRAIACDVGSRTDLIRTIDALKDLPPVRGVIHGALFLRDAIFENATFEEWQQSMGPKVRGAWNLHELFPNLDFFISLSSAVGITGKAGSSLYAGTSTFLGAFTEYRIKLGLPAVAVYLPAVQGVGFVVEHNLIDQLNATMGMTLDENQLYTLIEGAIIGPSSGLNVSGACFSWMLASKTHFESLVWEHFNPLSAMRRLRTHSGGGNPTSDGNKKLQELLADGSPEVLMDVLSDKVSSITMIDRDEIRPNRSLLEYGLDSLFSLELRNWIRRTLDADVALKDITSAKDLTALVDQILLLTKSTGSVSTLPISKNSEDEAAEGDSVSGYSSYPVQDVASSGLPLSPLLGVKDEEQEAIQKHLQSIGIDIPNVELVLPCAPLQEGILFAQLKNQGRKYFECLTLRITTKDATGDVDIDRVTAAWKALCRAQPMLRTVFTSSPLSVGAFQQIILKRTDPCISHATVDSQAGLQSVLETMDEPQFAAAQPPHHMHLTRASSSVVYASFYMSHAMIDNRSFRLIGQQLRRAYADSASIPKGLDFGRYIDWVQTHQGAAKDYWKAHLSGARPCLISVLNSSESSLLDKPWPPHIDVSITQPLLIHPFCRRYGVTVANLAQVAWAIVLGQCKGSQSVTFGFAQSQVGAIEGGERTLGPLLANVICRFDMGPETTPLGLLESAREDTSHALELPGFAVAEILETIGLGQSPLFDTSMSIVRYPPETPASADGIQAEFLLPDQDVTEYAMVIGVGFDRSRIISRLWYDTARVSRSLAGKIGSCFAALITKIVSDPDESIEALVSSVGKPSEAFSAQDVARNVYREAASQCELPTSSLEDLYPCSPLQQQQVRASIQQKSGGCMDQYVFKVPKHVSATKLCDAVDAVASANPALCTRFVSLRLGGICQVIVKATPTWNTEASLSDYLQWDKGFRIRYGGPLCRFGEVDQPDGERYFVLSLHPAIYDPWTLSLFTNAVSKVYEEDSKPPAPSLSFGAYIRGLSGRNNAQGAQDLGPAQPPRFLEAPSQFPRVPHDAPEADISNWRSLGFQLPLTETGDDVPTTLAMLPAAWALCLSRLGGDRKACFGIHVDGRSEPVEGIARMTGPVGAVVSCAIDLTTLKTRDSLLGAVQEHIKAATPFLKAPKPSEPSTSQNKGTTSQSFGNVLIIHNDPASVRQTEILELMQTRSSESSFDGARLITRCRAKPDNGVWIEMQFDKQVVSAEDVDILLQQYKHAITQLHSSPSASLADLEPVSDYERALLLEWNRNSPSRVDACVHDQIRDIAKRQPAAPAICSWDCDLDHGQLDDLSDRMATLLQQNGVEVGTMVPFFCEKSAAAIVVMLGILKAGAAFVALDVDHPAQRLATILANVGASTIVASSVLSERVRNKIVAKSTVLIDMERLQSLPHGGPDQVKTQPSDTCYITYTSGSTGTPKGVIVSHSNLASSVYHSRGPLGMTAATRALQFSNFIFDAVIYEVFMTLVVGGCVCMPQEAERMNDIAGAIQRTRANWVLLTPSTATLLIPSEVPTLSTLCLGGEPMRKNMIERWKHIRLVNSYGPCEATVASSHCIFSPTSGKYHLNIGRPTPSRYWVVNPSNHDQLVPFGCPGELLIQGPGIAQGYLGDAEQTRKAFIEPPIWTGDMELPDLSSQRWYKTGDLVKQTADGSVVYEGRKDTQIKLDGQRIETGEIEHHLESLSEPGWTLAVELIKPHDQGQDSSLAVFFAVPSGNDQSAGLETPCQLLPPFSQKVSTLRRALVSKVPAYMVPQYFIRLNRLPLTRSNKADRQWLRRLSASLTAEQLSAYSGLGDATGQVKTPQDVVNGEPKAEHVENPEAELRKLWGRTLSLPVDRIKTTDNFFSLGGSSLRTMRLVNAARRAGFALTVTNVFETPVFSDQAAAMRSAAPSGNDSTRSKGANVVPQPPPLSSTGISSSLKTCLRQHGLLMENIESVAAATDLQADMVAVSELDPKAYMSDFTMEFAAPGLEAAKMAGACERLIRHHPLLRTAFVQHGATLQQVVLRSVPDGLVQVVADEEEAGEGSGDYAGTNTVLGRTLPLFRLQATGGKCQKLRFFIHHALYDAFAYDIIFQDLQLAYSEQPLSKGPSFHAWVSHVNALDRSASKDFWTRTLQGSSMTYLVPPPTGLRPKMASASYDEISMYVPQIRIPYGTCGSAVQAAWALVLSRMTGKQDVVFGVPNANRDPGSFPDVDRIVGLCINHTPARARLDRVTTLGSLVAQFQAQTVASIPHLHVQTRDMIRTCTDWPAWTRFSSVVLYQNDDVKTRFFRPSGAKFGDVSSSVNAVGGVGQTADVWVHVTPTTSMDELEVQLWYWRETMPEEKAQWIARCFQTVLEAMPTALEQPLHRVAEEYTEMPLAVATTTEPSQASTAASQNGTTSPSPKPPSALTRTIVSQAWEEVGLVAQKDEEGDRSMFSGGADAADLVTTLLLSRCYQRNGHGLSMADLIAHPTQNGQASLLESKKEKLSNGEKEVEMNGHA